MEYYGVSHDGSSPVPIVNTDDSFRHFFLNTTNQTQLSSYLSQTADHILKPFPVGLSTDVGILVANPAYSGNSNFASGFSRDDYHGTVVWSWQLAMMAAGLARQLDRCEGGASGGNTVVPDFCKDVEIYGKVMMAYNALWDTIDTNKELLSGEVWSWEYNGEFKAVPLASLTSTESNVRQLWSLTFLAVHRETFDNPFVR